MFTRMGQSGKGLTGEASFGLQPKYEEELAREYVAECSRQRESRYKLLLIVTGGILMCS